MILRRFALGAIVLFAAVSSLSSQENKTALIIGNSSYSHFSRLTQPVGEARQMSAALRRLGFDVTLLLDGTQDEMYGALTDFEYKLKSRGGLAFFHFGGHGVQVDGANYLIPVDSEIPDERRVKSRALDVDEILGLMESSGSDTNVIILDACRDNPLPAGSRSGTRGLAAVHRPPPNSIIVYAADAGDTAQDGLFTPTLLKYLETPGGTFRMGSNNGDDDEKPIHSVTVSDFWIGEHEVTQGEWREVMGTTISRQRDKANPDWSLKGEYQLQLQRERVPSANRGRVGVCGSGRCIRQGYYVCGRQFSWKFGLV